MTQPPHHILILTSTGGNGHIQAAKAKEVEYKRLYPDAKIYKQDIMTDWIGKRFGSFSVNKWDVAQKTGDIIELERLVHLLPVAEWLVCIPVVFNCLFYILRHKIDLIIDTQPLGTSPIIRAVHFASKLLRRPIRIQKVITELPTEHVTHFFRPIRRLPKKYRQHLELVSPPPLCKEENFWEEQCGVPASQVDCTHLPLRPTFMEYLEKNREVGPLQIRLCIHDPKETHVIHNTARQGFLPVRRKKGSLELTIEDTHKVSMIMLGGNPPERSLIQYVKQFIEAIKQSETSDKHILFVFCSCIKKRSDLLQKEVHDIVRSDHAFPKNLTIIPLTYQEDDVIAPLIFRADATLTKSGGMTAMELLYAGHGSIWIHQEEMTTRQNLFPFVKRPHVPGMPKYAGMPIWEQGNVLYLKEKKGATLTTPENFIKITKDYFEDSAELMEQPIAANSRHA